MLLLMALFTMAGFSAESAAVHVKSITGGELPAAPEEWAQKSKWTVMTANISVAAAGNSVYVWSYYSGRIVRFERDVQTARIEYKESWLSPYKQKWVSVETNESKTCN